MLLLNLLFQSILLFSLFIHKTSIKEIVLSTSFDTPNSGSYPNVKNRRLFPSKNLL